jgi:hypothetical protein
MECFAGVDELLSVAQDLPPYLQITLVLPDRAKRCHDEDDCERAHE